MHYRAHQANPRSIISAEPSHATATGGNQVMFYSIARAATWNISGYLYLVVASLISTPVLIHSLGMGAFGQYSLILATLSLVSSLDLGLSQAVTRALAQDHQYSLSRRSLWATSSLLFVITGLLAGFISTFIAYRLHVKIEILPIIFALSLIANLVAHYSTLPQAEGHFGYLNIKTFVVGSANTVLAAYLAWRGEGILEILITQLVGYLVCLGFLGYFSLKYFPKPREGRASSSIARQLIGFGLKNQSGKLVGQIQAQYAKYLLRLATPIHLSAYLVSVGIVQKLVGGITQVATAIYPAVSRGTHGKQIRRSYYVIQLGLFTLALVGVGLYKLVGYQFLTLWLANPQLVEIVDRILSVMVWYFAILVLCPLPSSVLDGSGRPGLTSLFATVTTIIEITLSLVLYNTYGFMAPVYAALTALIITTPFLLHSTEKTLSRTK